MKIHLTKKQLIGWSITIITGVVLVLVFHQLNFHKCFIWNCVPERDFTVYDLTLPGELFPEGAGDLRLFPIRDSARGIEDASGSNYWENGTGIYVIQRLGTLDAANSYFEEEVYQVTRRWEELSGYESITNYQSENAQQYFVECGYVGRAVACIFIGQYEEYVILFNAYHLSNRQYIGVLNYIDTMMADRLNMD